MINKPSLNDKKYKSIIKDKSKFTNEVDFVRMSGGIYKSGAVTLESGQATPLLFTDSGRLKVDGTFSVDKVTIENVKVFSNDGTALKYGLCDLDGTLHNNITKIAGEDVTTGSGDVEDGTLRVTLATDDINLAEINTNIDTLSKVDFSTETTLALIKDDIAYLKKAIDEIFDENENFINVREQEPIFYNFSSVVLADVTNGTDDTYYYYVDMDTYKFLNLQLQLSGGTGTVTVTVQGTLQDDGTIPESCIYQDVSESIYGKSNWTASALLADKYGSMGAFKYVRIKVVANTSGANDADWLILSKRTY